MIVNDTCSPPVNKMRDNVFCYVLYYEVPKTIVFKSENIIRNPADAMNVILFLRQTA